MKMTPKLLIAGVFVAGTVLFFSCKKDHDNPDHNPPPSTNLNLKKGLQLYLQFNGNLADSSGNSNPVAAIGGAELTYDEHGYPYSAFGGTGAGQRLYVTNNGSIKFDTAFTLTYHVMVYDLRNQIFFSLVQPDNAHGFSFDGGLNVPGNEQFEWGVGDTTRTCDQIGDKNPNNVEDSTGFVPSPGSWYSMVLTYRMGTVKTYVNGKLVSTKTGTGVKTLNCPNAKLIVGGWWDGGPQTINGKMDELRFYNRVLNSDEINELSKGFQQ